MDFLEVDPLRLRPAAEVRPEEGVGVLRAADVRGRRLVRREAFADAAGDADLFEREVPRLEVRDDVVEVVFDDLGVLAVDDHVDDVLLDLFGYLCDIRPFVLEARDVDVVDVLTLLPDDVARVALFLARLEEPPVELLELDLEAMFVRAQLVAREVVVGGVDVLLDVERLLDGFFFRHVGAEFEHDGVGVVKDDTSNTVDEVFVFFDAQVVHVAVVVDFGQHGVSAFPVGATRPNSVRVFAVPILERVFLPPLREQHRETGSKFSARRLEVEVSLCVRFGVSWEFARPIAFDEQRQEQVLLLLRKVEDE